jgi:hypothetical protein
VPGQRRRRGHRETAPVGAGEAAQRRAPPAFLWPFGPRRRRCALTPRSAASFAIPPASCLPRRAWPEVITCSDRSLAGDLARLQVWGAAGLDLLMPHCLRRPGAMGAAKGPGGGGLSGESSWTSTSSIRIAIRRSSAKPPAPPRATRRCPSRKTMPPSCCPRSRRAAQPYPPSSTPSPQPRSGSCSSS